jgi:tRNA pseudouridine55 synthase
MYSAVKHHGQPLYKLARQGVHVERKARSVRIYSLELLRWEPPVATLQVTCSAGTYVRTLAHDLGEASGYGAYLAGLRRTAVGGFKIASAVTLAQLRREGVKAHLQSLDRAVAHLPRLAWPSEAATRLAQGQTLPRRDGDPTNGSARAYDDAGEFVGIVETDEGNWRPRKIFYQPS